MEEKEALFNDKKLKFNEYLKFLTQEAKRLNLDISKDYPNISPLERSPKIEKTLKTGEDSGRDKALSNSSKSETTDHRLQT